MESVISEKNMTEEQTNNNSLAKNFTLLSLFKFALPTIIMMVFTSMYTIVDGIFVSRLVGKDALSAINIVYPMLSIFGAIAVMLASGGSAIISRKMGEGDNEEAKKDFSLIIFSGIAIGIICTIIGLIFMTPIIYALGASEVLLPYCYDYLWIILITAPAVMLQILFQMFFVTAGKPTLGLIVTVSAGVANAVLDYIFMGPMNMGISGAALGTAIGFMIPATFGMIYFFIKKGTLYFVKPKFDLHVIAKSCTIGAAEMVTQLSTGIVTFMFNILMMNYLGEDGIAAITIVTYTQFLFIAMNLGFSMGVAPIISYNYGSKNVDRLKRIFKICMLFVGITSVILFGSSMLFASSVVSIFTKDKIVYDIAIKGFVLFSISYLFAGTNIFTSFLFTALSNGKIAAMISLSRSLVMIVAGIILLMPFMQVNGVWLAVPFAESTTLIISIVAIFKNRNVYNYI